jgi:pimeloyl-ACP methyl ester carboxylesterase/CRP-like cAMP-binding protein
MLSLLSKRFSCIAVDLPGYGSSPALPYRATIPGYADLLAELIRDVTDGPVVLVGHSMGGMISLTLALRYPMLVERMVLLNPTISGHLSDYIHWTVSPFTFMEGNKLGDSIISAIEPHLLKLTDRIMRPASFAERTEITEEVYRRLRADARRPGQGRVRAECYRAMRENDLRGKLQQIESPSLVIWGAEDNTVPLRDASVVADEWPNADLRIIPKAGHWPQFETPEKLRRYVASFLGLPLITSRLDDATSSATVVNEVARFLAHSDIGNGMSYAQRTRLAAQCNVHTYDANALIATAQDSGSELYVVKEGTIEVWLDHMLVGGARIETDQRLASLLPGQITGELALLDGGRRSANLHAGPEGATVLSLSRDRVVVLGEDDPPLGMRLVWNIATALALRLRLINWQMQQEKQKLLADQKREKQEFLTQQQKRERETPTAFPPSA